MKIKKRKMTLNKNNVSPETFLEKIMNNENEYDFKTPQFLFEDLEKMITRAFFFSYKTDENTYNYKYYLIHYYFLFLASVIIHYIICTLSKLMRLKKIVHRF